MSGTALSYAETTHINEMQEDLRRKLQESQRREGGSARNSLKTVVLNLIIGEHYGAAKEELEIYIEQKASYPSFQKRIDRYIQHCKGLIQAIQTKRSFPGLASLSITKQQEVHEKVLEHFEELKQTLKLIERIERDHRLMDLRSTVWVLRSLTLTMLMFAAGLFILDLRNGVMQAMWELGQLALDDATTWVIEKIFD